MDKVRNNVIWSARKVCSLLNDFRDDVRGSLVPIFAVTIPVLVASSGMAIDLGQAYLVRERLQGALDNAAIAGVAAGGMNEDMVRLRTEEFFNANYPDHRIGDTQNFNVAIDSVDKVATVTADAVFRTKFMGVLGKKNMTVSAETRVSLEIRGIEVALALDVTGSMQGSNISSLRTATLNFINILYDRATVPESVEISLVPYAATVNVGSIAPDIVTDLPTHDGSTVEYRYIDDPADLDDQLYWHGCVMARETPHDYMDTHPVQAHPVHGVGGYWEPFWWESTNGDSSNNRWDSDHGGSMNVPQNQCNNRRTPNLGCPEYNPIVPLTSDKARLLEAAENLTYWCRGGTLGNLGLVWAYRVLSNHVPFTNAEPYDGGGDTELGSSSTTLKAVVMMTDGNNQLWRKPGIDTNSDYSAYGYIEEGVLGTTSRNTGLGIVNSRLAQTCELMKNDGITVYTVTFEDSISNDTKELFRNCASDNKKYFDAPDGDSLVAVFETISRELANLHIQQ